MSNAHTPGPWRYDREGVRIVSETAFYDYGDPDDPQPVSVVSLFAAMGGEDTTADARLIAAAPDLLAALRDMLDMMGPLDDVANIRRKNAARAAIAKATGEEHTA